MSEQAPQNNPEEEQKPLQDNCDTCKKNYLLTPSNSGINVYELQSECNNIVCQCPHCKAVTRIFLTAETDWLERAQALGIQVCTDFLIPDEHVLNQFNKVYGVKAPTRYELTPRHEELVSLFSKTVVNMPPDQLYDEITMEHPRTLPERWAEG